MTVSAIRCDQVADLSQEYETKIAALTRRTDARMAPSVVFLALRTAELQRVVRALEASLAHQRSASGFFLFLMIQASASSSVRNPVTR